MSEKIKNRNQLKIIEKIYYLINSKKEYVTNSYNEAFNKIILNYDIIKIPNQKFEDIIIRRMNNNIGYLPDFITNFRINNKALGYLNTLKGEIIIPVFYPLHNKIIIEYGFPYRTEYKNIMFDAYIINDNLKNELIKLNKLPSYLDI